jgi:hypothetical protein
VDTNEEYEEDGVALCSPSERNCALVDWVNVKHKRFASDLFTLSVCHGRFRFGSEFRKEVTSFGYTDAKSLTLALTLQLST